MFGVFKKIFRKSTPASTSAGDTHGASVLTAPEWQGGVSRTETVDPGYSQAIGNAAPGECVAISFASILKQTPQELQGKNSPSGSAKFSLDVNRVLEQLPFGAVRVPFRELRRFAPVGVFAAHHAHDDKLIDLPLREIIPQLRPEYLARRKQVRLEPPEDGTELFNRSGKPVAPLRVIAKDELLKPEDRAAAAAATPAPAAPQPPAPAPEPVRPKTVKPVYPTPTAAPAQPSAPISLPAAAQATLATSAPQPQAPLRIPAPRIPVPEQVVQMPRPAVAPLPVAPTPAPAPAAPIAAPRIPAPRIPPPSVARPEDALAVPLGQLTEQWPDEICEIVDSWGPGFQCLLPMSTLGGAMKSGAIRFSWRDLRAWVSPAPPAGDDGIFDETVLDLPLKVIAPLYLAKCRAAPQRKMDVGGHIPDIFSKEGVVPPEEEATEEDLPADSEAQVLTISLSLISQKWPDALRKEIALLRLTDCKVELPLETIEAALKVGKFECYWKQVCHWLNPCPPAALASPHLEARLDLPLNLIAPLYLKQRPGGDVSSDATRAAAGEAAAPEPPTPRNLAELFNEPDKRTWTPNEIVHKTSQLPGVAGALMALQDGLLVASCMPPEWKSETIAAFMPQIFGRMTQYTKELKMGELESISVTVEQGTFQIFNVGIIYFAALAKSTSKLPQESLKLIVRELARHTR